jgi:hypothetical protein
MGKSKKSKNHFMDEKFESYKKIRKPVPKPSRLIDEGKEDKVKNWKSYLNDDYE